MEPPALPLIVVTVAVSQRQSDPDIAERKNRRYADAVERHGGRPLLIDATTAEADRRAAFEAMDGLLLSGGADIHPSRYGQQIAGSRDIEEDRDELESAAWEAAEARGVAVLGICRGFQAINVFSGGTLLQHVEGHAGPGWGTGSPAWMHDIRVEPATSLADLLAGGAALSVNTYHHQAVRESDLAPRLRPTAWADSPVGPVVEALEAEGERFVVGVQCHPERTEVTPPEMEHLFRAFVAAAASRFGRRRRSAQLGMRNGST